MQAQMTKKKKKIQKHPDEIEIFLDTITYLAIEIYGVIH